MLIVPYLHLVYNFAFFLLGLILGDWKNWRKYYPTILFFIAGDLIHNVVTSDYHLWRYQGELPPNHVLINLMIMFVVYPATTFIYLKYSIKGWNHFLFQWILWVFLYSIIEFINSRIGLISYHHNWNIWWSVLANIILFLSLRIHIRYPLGAWLIFLVNMIAIIMFFKVPIGT